LTQDPLGLTHRQLVSRSALAAASFATLNDPVLAMTYLRAADLAKPARVQFTVGDTRVVGNLSLPPRLERGRGYPGVAAAGSLTSVKEQMAENYAAELARRGIIALAIDYRHFGESGGEPRQYENPDTKAQDLSAAAAYQT
jgi:fermentation-respiration switch protein FrsA (DUF1100 family)